MEVYILLIIYLLICNTSLTLQYVQLLFIPHEIIVLNYLQQPSLFISVFLFRTYYDQFTLQYTLYYCKLISTFHLIQHLRSNFIQHVFIYTIESHQLHQSGIWKFTHHSKKGNCRVLTLAGCDAWITELYRLMEAGTINSFMY